MPKLCTAATSLACQAPEKTKPLLLEDNGPTGYKSTKARLAKEELGFKVLSLPRYSPNGNPLDFFLWADIEMRMTLTAPKVGNETLGK